MGNKMTERDRYVCLKIREARWDSQMTQKEVACRMHLSRSSYSYKENENRKITVDELIRFCQLFKKPIHYFIKQGDCIRIG